MKNFDTNRFGRVLKLDMAEGRKAIMLGTLFMTLLYLFFFWFAWNAVNHHTEIPDLNAHVNNICEGVAGFSMIAVFIFFLITASTLYRAEQKKQQRIAWLMLPATNFEKFLARWIYLLVFSIVGGVLPLFIADGIHMAWLSAADYPVQSMLASLAHLLPKPDKVNSYLGIIASFCLLTAIHAFYLLGGVFFKNLHFIITSVVFSILFTTFTTILNILRYFKILSPDNETLQSCISIGISGCLIALFTWGAYRLFCRWQVVTHKFVNV